MLSTSSTCTQAGFEKTKPTEGWGVGRTTSMGARVLVAKQQHLRRVWLKLGNIRNGGGGGGEKF
jgi:hypothetical protein